MMTVIADRKATIEPDLGLGGIKLRTKLIDMQSFLMDLVFSHKQSVLIVPPFEVRYEALNGDILICADARNGKIFKLVAMSGYEGQLFGKIFVGMPVKDALALEPKLYYNEAEEGLQIYGVPGLHLEVPENDPAPEVVPSLVISAISVYAHEIDTSLGNKGLW